MNLIGIYQVKGRQDYHLTTNPEGSKNLSKFFVKGLMLLAINQNL